MTKAGFLKSTCNSGWFQMQHHRLVSSPRLLSTLKHGYDHLWQIQTEMTVQPVFAFVCVCCNFNCSHSLSH